ncbi:MAG: response regulator [Armatimonadota bacterium]|nr:response regulator [bacterium]
MVTKGNVLVVDDEVNLCRILGAKLAKSGYSVVAVHDGLQAVEKVRESHFDIVLLDLILPKMDGLTALAEIRSTHSALPVIVMTACENAEALAQARTYGVQAYVNKPFDLDNLVSLVADTSKAESASREAKLPTTTVLFGKGQIVTLDFHNGNHSKVYTGQVCNKDDRTLSVLLSCQNADIPARSNVRCSLSACDAHYTFTTHVLKTVNGPEAVVVVDKPGVIYRAQRRAHARRPVRIPILYASASDEHFEPKNGEIRDLSLGGLSIAVPEELLPGDMLSVEFHNTTHSVKAKAQVLHSRNNESSEYVLGCRFTQADESLRELLDC